MQSSWACNSVRTYITMAHYDGNIDEDKMVALRWTIDEDKMVALSLTIDEGKMVALLWTYR